MRVDRRGFLALLGTLPLMGWIKPKPKPHHVRAENGWWWRYDEEGSEYVRMSDGGKWHPYPQNWTCLTCGVGHPIGSAHRWPGWSLEGHEKAPRSPAEPL